LRRQSFVSFIFLFIRGALQRRRRVGVLARQSSEFAVMVLALIDDGANQILIIRRNRPGFAVRDLANEFDRFFTERSARHRARDSRDATRRGAECGISQTFEDTLKRARGRGRGRGAGD